MSRPRTAPIADRRIFGDSLFKGEYTRKNLYKEIVKPIMADENIALNIRLAPTNMSRVQIVDKVKPQDKDLRAQFKLLKDAFTKNEELAEILSRRGDVKSTRVDYAGALRYYNLALLAVQQSGTQMAEIYVKRATVFVKLKDTTAALKDLGIATKMKRGISSSTEAKITKLRQILSRSCFRLEVMEQPDSLVNVQKKAFRDNFIFRVQGHQNPKIPATANYIDVKFNEEKGRHLVTKMDLAPGTTIIVEDPYVSVLINSLFLDTEHCGNSNCNKKSCSLIPCRGCMFVMYCDENCRMEDLKNGHLYLCPCMPQLHGLRTDSLMHICFRAICKAGPIELHDLYLANKEKKPEKLKPKHLKGFDPETGIYESNSYYQIRKLCSHAKNDPLPLQTIMAVLLAHLLNIKTDFYNGEPEGPERNRFIQYVAARILSHATSFSVNSFGLSEKLDKNPITTTSDDKYREFATAIYPFISLISHSCFPNSICKHLVSGKMAITTKGVIKSGEEINISYGYTYGKEELDMRRLNLKKYYNFDCSCIACSAEWPKLVDCGPESDFICSQCWGEVNYQGVAPGKYSVLTPTEGGKAECKNCMNEVHLATLSAELTDYKEKYEKAKELLDSNQAIEALPIILSCIEFFQQNLAPPSREVFCAMGLFSIIQSAIYLDVE